MEKEHEEKALAILQSLKGMRISEAQKLLEWCSNYLLNQPVAEWRRKNKD